ncbi:MAG: tRNA uridine-5-carboxymethylaminomethyl(34) synthesis GTPase MnmE [Candidatus Shikimatogenerans bostrichidophilus]|nr:MAG: tRNA uridine-5-carboxymethylaminomethyl(34) synthesis GTPase MnmE [Candidatus Shikimatogenerans bostrichidophilus]
MNNNYNIIYNNSDNRSTITAISSPMGIGAISIIRITGSLTLKIIKRIFINNKNKKVIKKKINFGFIKNKKNIIDKVILLYFKNPKSYTGEDLIEIYCHGSLYIQNKILKIIIKNGARLAINGEFTYRAYLNKKISLLQAESVFDIINSRNKREHNIAINSLIKNKLYKKISKIINNILNILSYIEIELDFIEENININNKKIYNSILEIEKKIKKMINSFKINNIINYGLNISIIGPVNSGKSTLMNKLINENKSIISNIPGTTRDIVEGKILINNFNFNLYDTAGIRNTNNKIEKIGIKKTFKSIEHSNIIFFVFNIKNLKKTIKYLIKNKKILNKKNILLIANKIDIYLNNKFKNKIDKKYIKIYNKKYNIIFISAKYEYGIKYIIDYLKKKIPNKINLNNNFINNQRHYKKLKKTLVYIKKVKKDYRKNIPLEYLTIDLRKSIEYLYNILGKNLDNNYILNNIFTKFCIGK